MFGREACLSATRVSKVFIVASDVYKDLAIAGLVCIGEI